MKTRETRQKNGKFEVTTALTPTTRGQGGLRRSGGQSNQEKWWSLLEEDTNLAGSSVKKSPKKRLKQQAAGKVNSKSKKAVSKFPESKEVVPEKSNSESERDLPKIPKSKKHVNEKSSSESEKGLPKFPESKEHVNEKNSSESEKELPKPAEWKEFVTEECNSESETTLLKYPESKEDASEKGNSNITEALLKTPESKEHSTDKSDSKSEMVAPKSPGFKSREIFSAVLKAEERPSNTSKLQPGASTVQNVQMQLNLSLESQNATKKLPKTAEGVIICQLSWPQIVPKSVEPTSSQSPHVVSEQQVLKNSPPKKKELMIVSHLVEKKAPLKDVQETKKRLKNVISTQPFDKKIEPVSKPVRQRSKKLKHGITTQASKPRFASNSTVPNSKQTTCKVPEEVILSNAEIIETLQKEELVVLPEIPEQEASKPDEEGYEPVDKDHEPKESMPNIVDDQQVNVSTVIVTSVKVIDGRSVMEVILPRRKVNLVDDSTQTDPDSVVTADVGTSTEEGTIPSDSVNNSTLSISSGQQPPTVVSSAPTNPPQRLKLKQVMLVAQPLNLKNTSSILPSTNQLKKIPVRLSGESSPIEASVISDFNKIDLSKLVNISSGSNAILSTKVVDTPPGVMARIAGSTCGTDAPPNKMIKLSGPTYLAPHTSTNSGETEVSCNNSNVVIRNNRPIIIRSQVQGAAVDSQVITELVRKVDFNKLMHMTTGSGTSTSTVVVNSSPKVTSKVDSPTCTIQGSVVKVNPISSIVKANALNPISSISKSKVSPSTASPLVMKRKVQTINEDVMSELLKVESSRTQKSSVGVGASSSTLVTDSPSVEMPSVSVPVPSAMELPPSVALTEVNKMSNAIVVSSVPSFVTTPKVFAARDVTSPQKIIGTIDLNKIVGVPSVGNPGSLSMVVNSPSSLVVATPPAKKAKVDFPTHVVQQVPSNPTEFQPCIIQQLVPQSGGIVTAPATGNIIDSVSSVVMKPLVQPASCGVQPLISVPRTMPQDIVSTSVSVPSGSATSVKVTCSPAATSRPSGSPLPKRNQLSAKSDSAAPTTSAPRTLVYSKKIQQAYEDFTQSLQPNSDGNIPLHRAVLLNNLNLVKRHAIVLRARKASLDFRNNDGHTPLHLAIVLGYSDIVEALLAFGAKPGITDDSGNTAIHMAVEWGHVKCLNVILRFPAAKEIINLYNDDGVGALHLTAKYPDRRESALLLVENGAELELQDAKSGKTPLFHAYENANDDIIKLLRKYGADIYKANFAGFTPIMADNSQAARRTE